MMNSTIDLLLKNENQCVPIPTNRSHTPRKTPSFRLPCVLRLPGIWRYTRSLRSPDQGSKKTNWQRPVTTNYSSPRRLWCYCFWPITNAGMIIIWLQEWKNSVRNADSSAQTARRRLTPGLLRYPDCRPHRRDCCRSLRDWFLLHRRYPGALRNSP